MDNATKLIASVTALLVAAGALVATLGLGGSDAPAGITVILDSQEAFDHFLRSHPSAG